MSQDAFATSDQPRVRACSHPEGTEAEGCPGLFQRGVAGISTCHGMASGNEPKLDEILIAKPRWSWLHREAIKRNGSIKLVVASDLIRRVKESGLDIPILFEPPRRQERQDERPGSSVRFRLMAPLVDAT